MTFGTRMSRSAPAASGAFASAASASSDGAVVVGALEDGGSMIAVAGGRTVESRSRDPVHEPENPGQLRLVEGSVSRRELEAGQRRDAGNREVLALGRHGRC